MFLFIFPAALSMKKNVLMELQQFKNQKIIDRLTSSAFRQLLASPLSIDQRPSGCRSESDISETRIPTLIFTLLEYNAFPSPLLTIFSSIWFGIPHRKMESWQSFFLLKNYHIHTGFNMVQSSTTVLHFPPPVWLRWATPHQPLNLLQLACRKTEEWRLNVKSLKRLLVLHMFAYLT